MNWFRLIILFLILNINTSVWGFGSGGGWNPPGGCDDGEMLTYQASTGSWICGSGTGTGDVTAASAFGTDNVLIKSDGTGKGAQATGITVDDSNNVSGVLSVVTPTINGSTAADGDLTLQGTSHSTRTTSYLNLQPNGGNVGIGTTTPNAKLDLSSTGVTNVLLLSPNTVESLGSGFFHFGGASQSPFFNLAGANTGSTVIGGGVNGEAFRRFRILGGGEILLGGGAATADVRIFRQAADMLGIDDSVYINGNVGIGTTSPGGKLHVSGGKLLMDNNQEVSWLDSGGVARRIFLTSSSNDMLFGDIDNANNSSVQFKAGGTGQLRVHTNGTEKLRISSAGGLSLGNSYVGTDAGAGNMIISGNVGIGTATPYGKFNIATAPVATANYGTLSVGSGAWDGSTIGKFVGSSSGTSIAVNEVSGYAGNLMDLQVAGTPRFKVNLDGSGTFSANVLALRVEASSTAPSTTGAFHYRSTITNTGDQIILRLAPTFNQASGTASNKIIEILTTETALGSGVQSFITAGTAAGGEKFAVRNTGQIISTLATGTAPLVVASTTQVANLNAATSGTAALAEGLTGTPNIEVGTVSAGGGGMTVDADGDTTVKTMTVTPTASPVVTLQDSDAPGADKQVLSMGAQYVDGADGAENSDWLLQIMQGGTLTTILYFDESDDQFETTKTISSSAPITTTSTIQGRVIFNSYDAAQTLTAAVHNGSVVRLTVTGEITMWDCETAGVGTFVTLWARDAEKIEVVPASGDHFSLFAGTALTADYELDMVATAGTKVTLMCTADDTWSVYNETATSTDGGAAD